MEPFKGGMRFIVPGAGFIDEVGFARSAKGEPPNLGGEDIYTHLDGRWYLWEESW